MWRLTKGYWFHFGSLISIIAFMLLGFSPVLSVFWATMLADRGQRAALRHRHGAVVAGDAASVSLGIVDPAAPRLPVSAAH